MEKIREHVWRKGSPHTVAPKGRFIGRANYLKLRKDICLVCQLERVVRSSNNGVSWQLKEYHRDGMKYNYEKWNRIKVTPECVSISAEERSKLVQSVQKDKLMPRKFK